MTRLRRLYVNGYLYFITSVTDSRRPLLVENIELFWDAIAKSQAKGPFDLIAWVVLPEHIHVLIDPKGLRISKVLQSIKISFAKRFVIKHKEPGAVWQSSFWDHVIRDEDDFRRHLDYIHLNSVKHGYVTNPFDWPHSSIMKFKGLYSDGWEIKDEHYKGDFGE